MEGSRPSPEGSPLSGETGAKTVWQTVSWRGCGKRNQELSPELSAAWRVAPGAGAAKALEAGGGLI